MVPGTRSSGKLRVPGAMAVCRLRKGNFSIAHFASILDAGFWRNKAQAEVDYIEEIYGKLYAYASPYLWLNMQQFYDL
jgi:hypothetical protein